MFVENAQSNEAKEQKESGLQKNKGSLSDDERKGSLVKSENYGKVQFCVKSLRLQK